jgi:hypothetical protein
VEDGSEACVYAVAGSERGKRSAPGGSCQAFEPACFTFRSARAVGD